MTPTSLSCTGCGGSGWVLYYQETVHGEQEEAYRLCKECLAPRYEAGGGDPEHACSRPGAAPYGLSYYCEKHMEDICAADSVDYAHELKYHLIWLPRRRLQVLVGDVADRLEELLAEKDEELNCDIEHLAIRPDHLHLFVNAPPSLAVSQLVYRFKGYTSRRLRQEFVHLRKMPSIWTTAYFAASAGRVSEVTIQKYIEAQSRRT